MPGFLNGCIIIANPELPDIPRFSNVRNRAVYIIRHDEEGAIGVGLNQNYVRPFSEFVEDFPQLSFVDPEALYSKKIIFGGPITNFLWILTQDKTVYPNTIDNGILRLNTHEDAFKNHNASNLAICGIGFLGWGSDQLENEVANLTWHIIPTSKEALSSLPFRQDYAGTIEVIKDLIYG